MLSVSVDVSGAEPIDQVRQLLEDHGVVVAAIDTAAEDTFADVDTLLSHVDATHADAVITVGPRSATALAVAVLCDLPLATAGALDGRRIRAIDTALHTGSEMHRGVLDVRVDDVRRLTVADLEIIGSNPMQLTVSDRGREHVVADVQSLRIGSERPSSGRLSIDHPGGPAYPADEIIIGDAPRETRVALDGREQRFRELSVRTHHRPLRELVVGQGRHRRPAADTPLL